MRLLTLLALMLPGLALAATVNLTWTLPNTNTDGTPLAVGDLATTTIEYGSCSGAAFGTKVGQIVVSAPLGATTSPNLTPGVWCFRAMVTTTPAKGSVSSSFSNIKSATVPPATPSPPTLLDAIIAFLKRLFGHFV